MGVLQRRLLKIGSGAPPRGVLIGCLFASIVATAPGQPVTTGSIARRDYFAAESFSVVDPVATAETLARSGESVPVVVRYEAGLAAAAVSQFEEAFARTRTAFLSGLEAAFGSREIGSREINSARFRTFRSEFQSENPLFPVNLVLAQSWAKGYDGNATRDRQAAALRQVLESRLIGSIRPASTVFLVRIPVGARVRQWGEVSSMARVVDPRELVTTEETGLEIRRQLDALDRVAGGFLSGLVQPNVVEDGHLTALLIRERLGDRATVRHYRAGEAIARSGELFTAWSVLALQHLQRSGIEVASAPPAIREGAPAQQPLPVVGILTEDTVPWGLIGAAAAVAGALSGFVLFFMLRRRGPSTPVADERLVPVDGGGNRQIKEALLPHLARALKDRLVHVLFAQRHALLENEEAASRRVAEMEARLARLQPALSERVKEYEARIERLERELMEKDQETRDLIRAKLVLARKELDEEVARNRIRWN